MQTVKSYEEVIQTNTCTYTIPQKWNKWIKVITSDKYKIRNQNNERQYKILFRQTLEKIDKWFDKTFPLTILSFYFLCHFISFKCICLEWKMEGVAFNLSMTSYFICVLNKLKVEVVTWNLAVARKFTAHIKMLFFFSFQRNEWTFLFKHLFICLFSLDSIFWNKDLQWKISRVYFCKKKKMGILFQHRLGFVKFLDWSINCKLFSNLRTPYFFPFSNQNKFKKKTSKISSPASV